MAKQIYMTNDDVENIVEKVCTELRSNFSGLKCYGSIDIKRSFTFKSDDRIAMLYFTPIAWIKMTALVSRFETEVQWHGLVRRISENEFEVTDIIVPPHEVSGATVTSEYKPYIEWMDGLDDDTFNAVRFHGHSHVNMAVSPSSVDTKYRLDLVTQLPKPTGNDDVFYIFLIINKKHEWSAEIYDLTNNALYNTDEIYMECYLDDSDIDSFIAEAKKVAVARTTYGGYGGASQYGGSYGGNSYGGNSYGGSSYGGSSHSGSKGTAPATQQSTGKGKGKKNGKSGGDYFGYDSLEEYYEAVYGEDWRDDETLTGVGADVDVDDDNDDNNPNSPFYVKEY